MVCIYCQRDTKVINSRPQKRLNRVWRRRRCIVCGVTFTTTEAVDLSGSITVQCLNHLEPFRRDQLFMSIYDSLKHRKTALADATGLTDTVVSKLMPTVENALLDTSAIITVTTTTLKHFDTASATHYQAFHPLSY